MNEMPKRIMENISLIGGGMRAMSLSKDNVNLASNHKGIIYFEFHEQG